MNESATPPTNSGSAVARANHKRDREELFRATDTTVSVQRRSAIGGIVLMSGEFAAALVRVAGLAVLSRLLSPEDFGLIAMVTAFTVLAENFKDLGLSDATVQAPTINRAQVSNLFWINLLICVGIAGALSALSPLVAWFYGEARLVSVTIAIATTFVFSGLVIQHQALLRRHMRFGQLALIQFASILLSQVAAVIAAASGAGYWALVVREVGRAIVVFVGTWVAVRWIPAHPRRDSGHRSLLRFGRDVTGFNIVTFLARNVDKMILGRLHGARVVGLYVNAYKTFAMSVSQIQYPINSVALSALSELQNDSEAFSSYFAKMMQVLTFLTMPIVVVVAVFADYVISLLLGDQWIAAVPVLIALSAGSLVEPIGQAVGPALVAVGRTKEYFFLGVLSSIALVAALAIGSIWGAVGAGVGRSVGIMIGTIVGLTYGLAATPVSRGKTIRAIVPSLSFSVAAGALMLVVRWSVGWDVAPVVALLIALLGAAAYLGAWLSMAKGRTMLRGLFAHAAGLLRRRSGRE